VIGSVTGVSGVQLYTCDDGGVTGVSGVQLYV